MESVRTEFLVCGAQKQNSMTYLDHLLDYMENLKGDVMIVKGDVMIVNEQGLAWSATSSIKSKAQAYQMEAIVGRPLFLILVYDTRRC